ncbi:hypothetical protein LZ31DRAFT_19967 [Colletotrichum somersetense]|nr:hypothetical protein LZ31DRAFT_19967 [Colletotrichum somersetense]
MTGSNPCGPSDDTDDSAVASDWACTDPTLASAPPQKALHTYLRYLRFGSGEAAANMSYSQRLASECPVVGGLQTAGDLTPEGNIHSTRRWMQKGASSNGPFGEWLCGATNPTNGWWSPISNPAANHFLVVSHDPDMHSPLSVLCVFLPCPFELDPCSKKRPLKGLARCGGLIQLTQQCKQSQSMHRNNLERRRRRKMCAICGVCWP